MDTNISRIVDSSLEPQQPNSCEREILKLSKLDNETLNDISNMFGVWKEADHCDKDDVYQIR